jgi:hypothetical protein
MTNTVSLYDDTYKHGQRYISGNLKSTAKHGKYNAEQERKPWCNNRSTTGSNQSTPSYLTPISKTIGQSQLSTSGTTPTSKLCQPTTPIESRATKMNMEKDQYGAAVSATTKPAQNLSKAVYTPKSMPGRNVPKTSSFQTEHLLSNASGCTQQSPITNAILPPTNARKPAKTTTTTSRHKPPEQCKAQTQPRNRRERKNNNKNNNNKTKQIEKNNNRDKKNKQNDRALTNNNNPSEQSKPHQTEDENNSTTVGQPNPQTPRVAATNASVLPPMATDRSAKMRT